MQGMRAVYWGPVRLAPGAYRRFESSVPAADASSTQPACHLMSLRGVCRLGPPCRSPCSRRARPRRQALKELRLTLPEIADLCEPSVCYGLRDDPGRTRTCNLWFRGPTPYPLCHRAIWGTVATTTRMQVQLCDLLRFALAAGPHSKRNCNEQWCKRCMRLMRFQVRVWGWVHAGWLALTLAPRPPPGLRSTCGLVAMTSASHAEGRQFDPGRV